MGRNSHDYLEQPRSQRYAALQQSKLPLETTRVICRDDREADRRILLYRRHIEQYGCIDKSFAGFMAALVEAQRLIDENVPLPAVKPNEDVLRCACGRVRAESEDGLCSGCRHKASGREKTACGFCGRPASVMTAMQHWRLKDGKRMCRGCDRDDSVQAAVAAQAERQVIEPVCA